MVCNDDSKAIVDYHKLRQKMLKTTRKGLKERHLSTPLALSSSQESLNCQSLETNSNVNSPIENSKSLSHLGSGYNTRNGGLSQKHNVFVIGIDGKPLTPTTNARARKFMRDKKAKPIWNKFSQFGIQMLVETRKETPKTALGIDFGTKFEGYSVVTGKENNLSVMWKLPNKKNIVKKLEERRTLRRARRQRNCRRREARFDNRSKKDFIAPSQLMMVQSRLKAISEFFKCYPIDTVALEDVKFNHRDKRWGKNFSTIEIGKNRISKWIRQRAYLNLYTGLDTQKLRQEFGYTKSSNKSAEIFNSHCSDALALASDLTSKEHIKQGKFIVVDDTYRPVRRRLQDTQPSKDGIRERYSTGNFKGIRKGTICEYGQIVGGAKNYYYIRNLNNKRIKKVVNKINWLSHQFKTKGVNKNAYNRMYEMSKKI